MYNKIIKHVIFPLHEKILGRDTYKYIQLLEKEQYLPRKDLEQLKFKKLKALLIHAEQNIPFYAKRFSKAGFAPSQMACIDDFKSLPLLSKEEIQQNLEDMKWKDTPGGLYRYNTGGSSGKPLVFYFDRRRQAYDAAARALVHKWWDIDIGDKELYLWGSPLEITKQDKLKDLRDRLTNDLLISAFEISEKQVPGMIEKIRKFNPKCIFGYPSTIDLFSKMAAKAGVASMPDAGVKVVFTTAEVLYDYQKENIGRFFGNVPVADGYGSREGGFVCHECKEKNYHIIDSNYIVELIRDGKEAASGESGEVVLTHLDAWGMPFIRYRTGDVAQAGTEPCVCGRTWATIKNIQGRTTDFVVTPDGRWQHALSVIYVVRDIEGVDEFKIIQHSVEDIEVLLKIHENLYPATGDQRIVKGIQKRMGDSVQVRVTKMDTIPRDASGKYRYVVSKVSAFNSD